MRTKIRIVDSKHVWYWNRLNFQPLFGKQARAPSPNLRVLLREEQRLDAREQQKSSLVLELLHLYAVIAELQRPKGMPSGAPYSYTVGKKRKPMS